MVFRGSVCVNGCVLHRDRVMNDTFSLCSRFQVQEVDAFILIGSEYNYFSERVVCLCRQDPGMYVRCTHTHTLRAHRFDIDIGSRAKHHVHHILTALFRCPVKGRL